MRVILQEAFSKNKGPYFILKTDFSLELSSLRATATSLSITVIIKGVVMLGSCP
jgi:hypothetical protein